MNSYLLALTVISVVITAGFAIVLSRMVREERRRSDARVQLLNGLASRQAAGPARTPVAVGDFEMRPAARISTVQDLFHEREVASAWPHRFAVIGALAVLLTITVWGLSQLGGNRSAQEVSAPAAAPAAAPGNADAPPLELLSMRHVNEDGTLTISGAVRNPRSGKLLKGVNATVLVFGPGGSFVTNMRAPLDFTTLAPGEESPFVIRVPLTSAIERYRIGFRTEDGRVLSHVDRRSPDSIAQKQVP